LRDNGHEPNIIEYLKNPPSANDINTICKLLCKDPIDIIRTSEKLYRDLNINDMDWDDDDLIIALVEFPKLLERPIVIRGGKGIIGRPPEKVLELL
jgi:arsenate reductase